jgi:transcription elongation factor GreA
MLDNAVIIEESHDHQVVSLGSKVKVKTHDGKTVSYTVVGIAEADPREGKISNESPVGEALLGKKVGETFDFHAPAGTLTWKIVSVE